TGNLESKLMKLKSGIRNEDGEIKECEMGKFKWERRNGKCEMGNGDREYEMRKFKCERRNGERRTREYEMEKLK
ncbi:hypothetical protein TNCV_1732121, partial [Trichonephila clavipes]